MNTSPDIVQQGNSPMILLPNGCRGQLRLYVPWFLAQCLYLCHLELVLLLVNLVWEKYKLLGYCPLILHLLMKFSLSPSHAPVPLPPSSAPKSTHLSFSPAATQHTEILSLLEQEKKKKSCCTPSEIWHNCSNNKQ